MIIIQNPPIPIPVPKCWGRNARNNSMHHSLLSVLAMDQHHITTHPLSKFTIKGQNYKCQTVSSCSRFPPLCLSQTLYLFQAASLKIRPWPTVYGQMLALHLYV